MYTLPGLTALIFPFASTVAIELLSDEYVTVLSVALFGVKRTAAAFVSPTFKFNCLSAK